MTKAPTPTEKSTKKVITKNATKNFDYATVADRLRTVNWSNSSHPIGVVKPVYERSTLTTRSRVSFISGKVLNISNMFCQSIHLYLPKYLSQDIIHPPWCSIVGATVTVHQFFCILLHTVHSSNG